MNGPRAWTVLVWVALALYATALVTYIVAVSMDRFSAMWIVLAAVCLGLGSTIVLEFHWRQQRGKTHTKDDRTRAGRSDHET